MTFVSRRPSNAFQRLIPFVCLDKVSCMPISEAIYVLTRQRPYAYVHMIAVQRISLGLPVLSSRASVSFPDTTVTSMPLSPANSMAANSATECAIMTARTRLARAGRRPVLGHQANMTIHAIHEVACYSTELYGLSTMRGIYSSIEIANQIFS